MSNKKYSLFIRKLGQLSSESKIHWDYLDNNKRLCNDLDLSEESFTYIEYNFIPDNSYYIYLEKKNMYILALSFEDDTQEIMLVPNTFKGKLSLRDTDYPEELTELFNEIRHQFPNPEDFIEDLLKDDL